MNFSENEAHFEIYRSKNEHFARRCRHYKSKNSKAEWLAYHYCSVYTAHLLFWLVLANEDAYKASVEPRLVEPFDSGIKVYRTERGVN